MRGASLKEDLQSKCVHTLSLSLFLCFLQETVHDPHLVEQHLFTVDKQDPNHISTPYQMPKDCAYDGADDRCVRQGESMRWRGVVSITLFLLLTAFQVSSPLL